MKLNKETLKRIIKEELESMLGEEQSEAYGLGYDAGSMNMPASIDMAEDPEYMRGYNDGLAAGGHPPLEPYKPYNP